jgi:hypothetical protein
MPVDGARQQPRDHEGLSLRHQVFHMLRSIRTRVLAWRAAHRQEALPDAVVIGTLRRPKLAIAMRATVVPTETTPPPMREFLTRIVAHPPQSLLSPLLAAPGTVAGRSPGGGEADRLRVSPVWHPDPVDPC